MLGRHGYLPCMETHMALYLHRQQRFTTRCVLPSSLPLPTLPCECSNIYVSHRALETPHSVDLLLMQRMDWTIGHLHRFLACEVTCGSRGHLLSYIPVMASLIHKLHPFLNHTVPPDIEVTLCTYYGNFTPSNSS